MKHFQQTPAEEEAAALIASLSKRGITLRIERQALKWSTQGKTGLTIADIRAIKRLDAELKALINHFAVINAQIDARMRDRDGGVA